MRTKSKTEMTSFLDDNQGDKLDKISRGVKRVDLRLYTHHQVFYQCYRSLMDEI